MTNQVIPAEAVEAAAKAMFEEVFAPNIWVEEDEIYKNQFRDSMRRALDAAAPYMQGCHQSRGWVAKTRNTDGRVGIIGHFQDEVEAERWADKWNESTGRMSAFVERDTK